MVKIKQSPKLPAEERRLQLLMAAQKLFARKGYRSTTTNEIAKKANLTKGALYFHFKNKEDILFELIKHVINHIHASFDENADKLVSPVDYLKMFGSPKCKEYCGHEEKVRKAFFILSLPAILSICSLPRTLPNLPSSCDSNSKQFAAPFKR